MLFTNINIWGLIELTSLTLIRFDGYRYRPELALAVNFNY